MSKLTDTFRERFIRPVVEKETANLRKELNRAKNQIEARSFDMVASVGSKNSYTTWQNQQLLKVYFSWAYANITVIAARVADITLEMYRVNGKNIVEVEEHPLLELLNRVNDYQTKWDLVYNWTVNILAQGEACWYLVGAKNEFSQPTEIWPLKPEYIKIIPGELGSNEFIKAYEYRLPGKGVETFQPHEILFFKEPHPTNMYRGYGTLEAAAQDVLIDYHATNYNQTFFENQARPDGVLETDSKLSQSVYDRLVEKWAEKYRGTNNAGKTAILEQGLKYKTVQQTAKDMDYLEQQRWIRDKIMAMFKNTKVALGIVEDVNRANAEASEEVWIKHNIKPKMQRLVSYVNEFLTPRYGNNIFLGFEDPAPDNIELRLADNEKSVGRWKTINEVREENNLEKVEGGDFLYVPLNLSPVNDPERPNVTPANENPLPPADEEGKRYLKLEVKTDGKQNMLRRRYSRELKNVRLRQYRDKRDLKLIMAAVNKEIIGNLQKTNKHLKVDGYYTEQGKQAQWEIMVKLAGGFEVNIVKLVLAVINKHRDKTLKNLESYKPQEGKAVKHAGEAFVPADEAYVKVSIDAITPVITELVREQGLQALAFLGVDTQFTITEAIKTSVRKFVGKASESYVSTLREHIGNTILKGIQAGWSVEKMQREIRKDYNNFSRPQALRLARSETIRASNFAQEEAYKESGVVEGKQWFTALDERVCPYCEALNGKVFGLNETILEKGSEFLGNADTPLSIDYTDIEFPPLHANCRCSLAPVISKKDVKPSNKLLKLMVVPKGKKKTAQPQFEEAVAKEVEKQVGHIQTELEKKLEAEVEKLTEQITNELS